MSKLVEKLNNLSKPAGPSMGFRTAGAVEKAMSMVLIVELTGRPEDEVRDIAGLKVTAGIVDSAGLSAAALSKYSKGADSMPVGLNLSGGKVGSGWKLVNGDIDFSIFDARTPVSVFEGKDLDSLGKVLALGLDAESGMLRSLSSLYPDIDAVLIDLRESELTIEALMNCRRMADFAGRNILALVGSSLSLPELLALRGAGVKGLVLPADSGIDEIRAIADRVVALPQPDKRKDKKDVVLLPKLGLAPAAKEENGGDDGDDGDVGE